MMWITSLVLSAAMSTTAVTDDHGCQERSHGPGESCLCTIEVDFYRPGPGTGGHGGPGGPGGPGGSGSGVFNVSAPGARVIGRPIRVDGPVVHIAGPPIYVDAPPVYASSAQIYLARPEVIVRPSEVVVAPPEVHVEPCPNGGACTN